MKLFLQYSLVALFFYSCSNQDKEKRSSDYNNRGADLLLSGDSSEDENKHNKLLDDAVSYFDSAIFINPTATSFENKIKTLCRQKKYDLALTTIQDWQKLEVTPGNTTMEGFLYEMKGNLADANKFYLQAIKLYQLGIPHSKNPTLDKINIAFLKGFTENPEVAKKEFTRISKENPTDKNVEFLTEAFEQFDRTEFIMQMSQ